MGGERIALRKVPFGVTKGSNNAVFTGKNNSCAILDKFERQENVGKEGKQECVKNERLEKMKQAFSEYLGIKRNATWHGEKYKDALRIAKPLKYTSEDVTIFSSSLMQFEEEIDFATKAGLFLSALINSSREREFVIVTHNLEAQISFIGYKNTKSITVEGSTGGCTGCQMKGGIGTALAAWFSIDSPNNGLPARFWPGKGRITVNGDAGFRTGYEMGGGTLIVNGNSANETGSHMYGGRILVKGNVGDQTGQNMIRGRVTVEGDSGEHVGQAMIGGRIKVGGRIAGIGEFYTLREAVENMFVYPPYFAFKAKQLLFSGASRIFEGNRQVHGLGKTLYNGWQRAKEFFQGNE